MKNFDEFNESAASSENDEIDGFLSTEKVPDFSVTLEIDSKPPSPLAHVSVQIPEIYIVHNFKSIPNNVFDIYPVYILDKIDNYVENMENDINDELNQCIQNIQKILIAQGANIDKFHKEHFKLSKKFGL